MLNIDAEKCISPLRNRIDAQITLVWAISPHFKTFPEILAST